MSITVCTSNLIAKTTEFVKAYMSQHDASHDFSHIERVVTIAHKILKAEKENYPYDTSIVTLSALMHDVGDHKYRDLKGALREDPTTIVASTLISFGASSELANYIQTIATNVSYSSEIANPTHVQAIILTHPELKIVQDADRLDTLGAIGIARIFTFGGVRGRENGLQGNVDHFQEKLYRLTSMMKTEEGRKMAEKRTLRNREFEKWFNEEMELDES